MDYKRILAGIGESAGVIVLLVIFIIILTLVMLSLGPQAPSVQQLICNAIGNTTFCHP